MRTLIAALICLANLSCGMDRQASPTIVHTPTIQPDSYSNLTFWLKPETLSSLANNQAINSWKDSSSAQVTIAQANNSRAPLAVTNGLNGYTVAAFDGTKFMVLPGYFPVTGSSSRTVFIVVVNAVFRGSEYREEILSYGDSATRSSFVFSLSMGSNNQFGFAFSNSDLLSNHPITSEPMIISFRYDGAVAKIFLNGTLYGTKTVALSTATTFPLTLGKNFNTGYHVYFGQFHLAEIIFYDRHLSDTEFNNISYYLHQKFNIP